MKRNLPTLLAMPLFMLSVIIAQSPQTPTDADWDWVETVENRAYEALMPLALRAGQVVAYRTYHDFQRLGDIERHFTISYATQGGFDPEAFSAVVVTPVGRSIQRQLLELHMADRRAPFDDVLAKVAIRRITVNPSQCPAVRQSMRALSDTSIKVPLEDRILSHPVSHRIVVRSQSLMLDATDRDERSPLVQWAIRTNDNLLACGKH